MMTDQQKLFHLMERIVALEGTVLILKLAKEKNENEKTTDNRDNGVPAGPGPGAKNKDGGDAPGELPAVHG